METRNFTDFLTMCEAIADHTRATGANVLPADEPPDYLGYLAVQRAEGDEPEQSVLFQILIQDIEPSLTRAQQEPDPDQAAWDEQALNSLTGKPTQGVKAPKSIKAQLFRQCLASQEGRIRLAVSFPGQRIDRAGLEFSET